MNRKYVVIAGPIVGLVFVGIILGGVLDAAGLSWIPIPGILSRLPKWLQIALEIVVGIPLALGVMVYAVLQILEFLGIVTWPFRKLAQAVTKEHRDYF